MTRPGSPSPARRPQLGQRASSSHSVSKGSPTAGHLSKSHKGSSTKLHKTHAVGHGRHGHARVPSYGKGMHKLSKLGAGEGGDSVTTTKHHKRSGSDTPTGSPTTQNTKRNSSQISLPRTGSKVSVKRNASNVSMTKLGNQSKSEKAQTKLNLRKKGTDDVTLKRAAKFSVGEDEQDEDWEEASNSQSPQTTRHNSLGRKTPQLEDPPSPDEPPGRSPTNLPQSPPLSRPQSPPTQPSAFVEHTKVESQQKSTKYSHPLDGDEVSHRLLDRSRHDAAPKLSNISASVTPNGSVGSPAFKNHGSSFTKEPSMPADGISRFLGTGSTSGSETPGSISHLQSNLAAQISSPHRPASPAPDSSKAAARRVQSAANLTHPRLTKNSSTASASPPKTSHSSSKTQGQQPGLNPHNKPPSVSPYESARGLDPTAGKSMTQLKLNLQRMSTLHDTPSPSHPLMFQHGSSALHNLNASSGEMAARLGRQYQQAGSEYCNARRYYPDLVVEKGGLAKKVAGRKVKGDKEKGAKTSATATTTPVGSSGAGARGRVSFEVGSAGKSTEDGAGEEVGVVGVEGLLRRMWCQGMDGGMNED
ncbi:hypothetical protein ACLMJK_007777 [Lecanora helva]